MPNSNLATTKVDSTKSVIHDVSIFVELKLIGFAKVYHH